MHATVRRYEGVDVSRTDELTKKVNENLIPKLSKLPGFDGYFLSNGPGDPAAVGYALGTIRELADAGLLAAIRDARSQGIDPARYRPEPLDAATGAVMLGLVALKL